MPTVDTFAAQTNGDIEMKVQVNTKGNYRDLNGKWLNVQDAQGTRVSVVASVDGRDTTIDFQLKEVTAIQYN